jgi:hypothetical protein
MKKFVIKNIYVKSYIWFQWSTKIYHFFIILIIKKENKDLGRLDSVEEQNLKKSYPWRTSSNGAPWLCSPEYPKPPTPIIHHIHIFHIDHTHLSSLPLSFSLNHLSSFSLSFSRVSFYSLSHI